MKRLMLALSAVMLLVTGAEPIRVTLTFDDSLKDHLLVAAPELEKRGWRGTFNIVTDWVGKDERFMTWDDVRELVRRGHEVAVHTKSHPNLVQMLEKGQESSVRLEIAVARDIIAEKTGFAPRFLCAPFVKQNGETERICREEGLRQMLDCRRNFGKGEENAVTNVIAEARANDSVRLDLLHHGVSASDHGGWNSFADRAAFARHLDHIVRLEREGQLIVTDYDGMISDCALRATAWPRHGVVALSFDDHNLAAWTNAFPLFAQHDARVTFFVSGAIGPAEIAFARQAHASGHEFALHGLKHRNADREQASVGLDAYWATEVEPQLAACRAAGISVRSYAYPNCRHTPETDELFVRHGFTRLRGNLAEVPIPHPYDPQGKLLDQWKPLATYDGMYAPATTFLSRCLIANVIMGEAYHTDIEDILAAMDRAGRRAELLSIVSHGISPGARGINMKTEWLERMLSSARRLGVVVRGVR